MAARVIGITGNIGSGKSTIAHELTRLGCIHIDADVVARSLMEPQLPAWRAIVERFSNSVLDRDGRIDRARLGQLVFSDAEALHDLDAAVHPLVIRRLLELVDGMPADTIACVEAIKLVEAGFAEHVDSLWLVVVPDDIAIERLVRGRGLTAEEAQRRLAAQPASEPKRAIADVVIDNGDGVELTSRRVRSAFVALQNLWEGDRSVP